MPYTVNASGQFIYTSATAVKAFYATATTVTLAGTSAAEALWGKAGVSMTLSGGFGDDTYYVYSNSNKVSEQAGGGVDSVTTWMSYILPDNVENLYVSGSDLYAFGNKLDNIVQGGTGRQTIDGKGGNDILTGGAGSDIFVVSKGNGSDLITDFAAGAGGDVIRLANYGVTSFSALQTKMKQVAGNVVVDLGGNEKLVLNNVSADKLTAANFQLSLDTSGMKQVFSDNFNSLSLFNGTSGTWKTTYYWGDRTLAGNAEKQIYTDPTYKNLGLSPFTTGDGTLTITADRLTAAEKTALGGFDFSSGLITSERSFSMQYGYFEMRADLPEGSGLWPAFWMLPIDGDWPPELDVMEALGGDPNVVHATVHTSQTGSHTSSHAAVAMGDLSTGYHTYGVDWQADTITWYVDGVEVYSAATPSDMHKPMYMLANLAVGGWAGAASASLTSAEMKIDYIKAYQTASDHVAVGVPKSWAPINAATAFSSIDASGTKIAYDWSTKMKPTDVKLTLSGDWARYATGNDLNNYIAGSNAQYNELDGGKGNDVLKGNGGTDVFIVRDGGGNDRILDFSNTAGNTDKIQLMGFHFTHFSDVLPFLTQVGSGVMLRLDADQAVMFDNTTIAQLSPEQFIFLDSVAAPSSALPVSAVVSPVTTSPAPAAEVMVPVTAPVAAPVTAPAAEPVVAPAAAPVVAPVVTPVVAPVQTPAVRDVHATDATKMDVALGSTGIDRIIFSGTKAIVLPSNVEDIMVSSSSAKITGNALANHITLGGGYNEVDGRAGNDVIIGGNNGNNLRGGDGDDIIRGGSSADLLSGGAGNDTFVFAKGDLAKKGGSVDQIGDFTGAGETGGDTLRFDGFGAGSTLKFAGYHQLYSGGKMTGVDQTWQYYDVMDSGTYAGTIFVHGSANQLTQRDYVFS